MVMDVGVEIGPSPGVGSPERSGAGPAERMSAAPGAGPGDLRQAGYELVCRLGEGGMGEVWAAARVGVEGAIKPCAIKVIRPALAGDERYRRLFVAEGRVAMMLGHANIVSVFDVGVVDDLLFMAMDWVDGVDLGSFRQQVQLAAGGWALAVEDAVHVVGALLDALGYAHGFCIAGREHGIVHRDVSPGNVMITSRGEVKLMDFGLAGLDRLERGLERGLGCGAGPRFRGTLRYLSREQARGRPEPASDLFAVGAILHELLDGRKFRHWCATDDALVAEIFEGGIPPLARRVPAPIEALRRGLLEPRVELRIKTARRALTALAEWPGYRNRRLQLESLYRQVIGDPRSGLTQLLSLGVHSELLDELRRRVEVGRVVAPPPSAPRRGARVARVAEGTARPLPREALRTVPHPTARGGEPRGRGRSIGGLEREDAVVCARPPERVSAHRMAQETEACDEPGLRSSAAARAVDDALEPGSGPHPASPPEPEDDPFEREITEPWPARAAMVEHAVEASAPSPSMAGPEPSTPSPSGAAAREEAAGARLVTPLALRPWLMRLVVLAVVVSGLSTLAVVSLARGAGLRGAQAPRPLERALGESRP
jgi:serine/threonine protein kinase